jgi:LEA14-like dessication related protein
VNTKRRICFFLVLLGILSGFAASMSLEEDIQITLQEKRIEDFDLSGLSLVFYLNIENSSSRTYYLYSYDYGFLVNQQEFFRLQRSLESMIKIEPRKNKLLSFPIKITFAHLFRLVEGIEKEDKAGGAWTGSMAFSDGKKERGRLSFDFTGEFPILKKPEVKFISLQVRDLTIGGADIVFEANFVNPNAFDLTVERISYKYFLRDSLVGEATVNEKKYIKSKGEAAFSFPVLLNFFDVGKEVYTMLQRSSSLCRFSGEVEVTTEWGRLKIPFDKTDRVIISRNP